MHLYTTAEMSARALVTYRKFHVQDGLLHISELRKAAQQARQAHQPDAYSLASVGDLVRVQVLMVDAKKGRISLGLA